MSVSTSPGTATRPVRSSTCPSSRRLGIVLGGVMGGLRAAASMASPMRWPRGWSGEEGIASADLLTPPELSVVRSIGARVAQRAESVVPTARMPDPPCSEPAGEQPPAIASGEVLREGILEEGPVSLV